MKELSLCSMKGDSEEWSMEKEKELIYEQPECLFAIEVECKKCGSNKVTITFNSHDRVFTIKCENPKCNAEDTISL